MSAHVETPTAIAHRWVEVLDKAIVPAAISSDAPIGIGVGHGWRRVGEPMLVTASRDNRLDEIDEIDDMPSLDVYPDRLDAPPTARSHAAAFTRFALTHPLGVDAGIAREVGHMAGWAGGAPVASFSTYGEIARTRGTSGFHNQTLVVLALA